MPSGRDLLLDLYDAAILGAAPGPSTTRAVDALAIERDRRVMLFAFGKAAHAMATAAVASLLRSLHQIVGGLLVSPEGAPTPYPTITSIRGDHPLPGRSSFAAASKVGEIAAGRRATDVVIVLISGGTSSLIGAPLRGQSESDLTQLHELVLDSGLDIAAMNAVRKRFSRWGGGRLALALSPAASHCLAISDVIGDDLSVIGSGPCVPDPVTVTDVTAILQRAGLYTRISQTHREYLTGVMRGITPETPKRMHPAFAHVTARVIATNRIALDGIAGRAAEHGVVAEIVAEPLAGPAAAAGERIARALLDARVTGSPSRCIAWGGETTVTLTPGSRATGAGGRCQELALAAARVLRDAGEAATGISLLAAGTDGRDGTTDAAGASVDSTTWDAIRHTGRDPALSLARHESHDALRAAGALLPKRLTGTNVMDVVIGLTGA